MEEKLNEAGQKLDELLNNPKTKQKAEDTSRQINDFLDRTGNTIATGIESFIKSVGSAAESFRKSWNETQKQADEPKDKGDE